MDVATPDAWRVDADDHGADAELRGQPYVAAGSETPAAALPDPQGRGGRPLGGHGVAQARRTYSVGYGS